MSLMPTPEQWAYAAGIMDGEGSLCMGYESPVDRPSPRWHTEVRFSNTSRALIDWFVSLFGGHVYDHHRSGNRQQLWTWKISARADCRWFLTGILPFLVVKRRQAELLMEFWSGFDPKAARKAVPEAEHRRRLDIVTAFRAIKTRKQPCKALS